MGRYIDWKNVADRYPDAAKITGAIDSSWINEAEAEIDARLAVRYATPFVIAGTVTTYAPPDLVKGLCIDLAYYKLTWRQKDSEKLYEYIENRLTTLTNGTALLPGSYSISTPLPWSSNSYHTVFGPDAPEEWVRDPQESIDMAGRRGD